MIKRCDFEDRRCAFYDRIFCPSRSCKTIIELSLSYGSGTPSKGPAGRTGPNDVSQGSL